MPLRLSPSNGAPAGSEKSSSGAKRRRFVAAALAAGLAAGAPGAVRSAHWKSTVAVEGARPGQALQEAEIWMRGGRMRIAERGEGGERTNVLETEDAVYVWVEGQSTGMRIGGGLAARAGRPSHAYVRRVEEVRARGKKIGSEKVEGFACDVFEHESPQDGAGTYWLAARLQDFPVKAVLERKVVLPYRSRGVPTTRLEYRNTDIRIPGKIPDSLLELPPGVRFQDASELMVPGRPVR